MGQQVSSLSNLSKLGHDNNIASKIDEVDRLHAMFLAMANARAMMNSATVKLEQALKAEDIFEDVFQL
ncbi:hypothetical protein Drorol1_Dr00026753 [Drosera rotundifolia]